MRYLLISNFKTANTDNPDRSVPQVLPDQQEETALMEEMAALET